MTRPVRTAALAILLAGCAAGPRAAVHPAPGPLAWLDRLYFGRSVEGRDSVSDADWERFLRETVVPRFPDGFTVLHAEGRWRGADTTEAERSFVLEVVHAGDSTAEARVLEVARAYRTRFRQKAVLRVRTAADAAILRGEN